MTSGFILKPKFGANWRNQQGFTLIELLVVVAIIGLLLSLISVTFNTTRLKARDTRRISDMKQLKAGMDLYYSNGGGYPDSALWVIGSTLNCAGATIVQVPKDPSTLYSYTYTTGGTSSVSANGCGTVWSAYTLRFYIENKAAYYTMDQEGTVRDAGNVVVSFDSLLK